jgi:hypothetical protein
VREDRDRLIRRGLLGSAGILVALLLLLGLLTGYTLASGRTISLELGIIGVRTGPRPTPTIPLSSSNAPLRLGLTSLPGQPQCPAPRLILDVGAAEINLPACLWRAVFLPPRHPRL